MAHRRLVTAINDNYSINDDNYRSTRFKVAAKRKLSNTSCRLSDGRNNYQINSVQHVTDVNGVFSSKPSTYQQVKYVTPRKQNILQRLWRRLKRDKLRKLAKKITNAEETIAIDRRWYHKLIWCRGETDPDDLLMENSVPPPPGFKESEHIVIADETLVIIGKQLPTNEEDSVSLSSSLSDGSSDEDEDEKLLDSSRLRTPAEQQGLLSQQGFEIEAVGIGSVVYFPPVENTIFAKGRPLPKIEKKGPHPWSYQLSDDKKEHTAAQVDPKPTTSRPLPRIEEHRSNVKLNKTVKDSMDSGIDEFADEANEEIERAMRAACGRSIPAKKNNKKREEWLLCQTPNLEKGPSGFSWQLDHKLTGPCHRASTPRPQLTSSTLRPMKRRTAVEISLGQELAQKKRDQLIELRNTKIHDRQERFLGSQETKELDHEVHKQKLINDQREKERHLKERLEIAKQKKPQKGSTDAKLAFARQRRQQQAKLENQGQKSTVGNVQVSSTKAAGFRSSTQKSKKVFVSFQAYEDTPLPALPQAKDTSTGPKNTSGSNMRVHTPGPVNSRVMGLIKKPKVKQMPADKPVKKVPSLTLANRTKISRAVSFERVSSPVHSNAYEATREQSNAHSKKVISDIDVNTKAPAQKMVPPLLKSAPVQKRFPVAMTMKEAIRKAEEARKEREEQEKERKERKKEEDQQYWKEFDKDWNDFYSLDEEEQQIESSSTDYTEYEF